MSIMTATVFRPAPLQGFQSSKSALRCSDGCGAESLVSEGLFSRAFSSSEMKCLHPSGSICEKAIIERSPKGDSHCTVQSYCILNTTCRSVTFSRRDKWLVKGIVSL